MNYFNTQDDVDKIFNILTTYSESTLPYMETLYETDYYFNSHTSLRLIIACDENKRLFMLVKGEGEPCLGTLSCYRPEEGMILYFPISPAAAMECRRAYFLGNRSMLDSEADQPVTPPTECSLIWEYRHGAMSHQFNYIHEGLFYDKVNGFMLLSTDASYPLCFRKTTMWDENVLVYHLTMETACRWAMARNMSIFDWNNIFPYSAPSSGPDDRTGESKPYVPECDPYVLEYDPYVL